MIEIKPPTPKTLDEIKELFREYYNFDEEILDNLIFLDTPSYTDAIIGVSDDNRVIYDYDKMVLSLMNADEMSEEEAIEFIEYNTIRALPYASSLADGALAPMIMYHVPGLD